LPPRDEDVAESAALVADEVLVDPEQGREEWAPRT
jgi:hypothetical protein